MDQRAILDHQFVVAAYIATWVIQLSYLAWLAYKWRSEKRIAARRSSQPRRATSAPIHADAAPWTRVEPNNKPGPVNLKS